MLQLDDLEVNLWVAFRELPKRPPILHKHDDIIVGMQPHIPKGWESVDGRPYQIKAICLPFLALYCPLSKCHFSIDSRGIVFQKMSMSFVNIFLENSRSANFSEEDVQQDIPQEEETDVLCVTCLSKMYFRDGAYQCEICERRRKQKTS